MVLCEFRNLENQAKRRNDKNDLVRALDMDLIILIIQIIQNI